MKEVLQNLANLQYIDSKIDDLKRLRGDLPEEILDIETDVSRLDAKLSRAKAEQKELTLEKKNLELEIADSTALVQKYEDQQMTVRNNREYDALTKEIESQKQKIENAKSRLEEIEMLQDEFSDSAAGLEQEFEKAKALLDEKKSNLDELVQSTKTEEEALLEKRKLAEQQLETRYLRSYERLRNGLNNSLAVVPMDKGAALGMSLPPQTQVEIRRMNKIIIDENSGRIVVDQAFFDEAAKNFANMK